MTTNNLSKLKISIISTAVLAALTSIVYKYKKVDGCDDVDGDEMMVDVAVEMVMTLVIMVRCDGQVGDYQIDEHMQELNQ